jgi:hypothetical protein
MPSANVWGIVMEEGGRRQQSTVRNVGFHSLGGKLPLSFWARDAVRSDISLVLRTKIAAKKKRMTRPFAHSGSLTSEYGVWCPKSAIDVMQSMDRKAMAAQRLFGLEWQFEISSLSPRELCRPIEQLSRAQYG